MGETGASSDTIWDGFVTAIVRLELPDGAVVLRPQATGAGAFPFDAPVHIVTAYNPDGIEQASADNEHRHRSLGEALTGAATIASIGSAPDGSMAEPGYAVLGWPLDQARALGRTFGQLAIYRWTPDALHIVGCTDDTDRVSGWSLEPAAG